MYIYLTYTTITGADAHNFVLRDTKDEALLSLALIIHDNLRYPDYIYIKEIEIIEYNGKRMIEPFQTNSTGVIFGNPLTSLFPVVESVSKIPFEEFTGSEYWLAAAFGGCIFI